MRLAVIPAKAGIQSHMRIAPSPWAPAFAGVTMNQSDA